MPTKTKDLLPAADRNGKRWRPVAASCVGAAALLSVVTAFALAPATDNEQVLRQTIVESLASGGTFAALPADGPFMHEEIIRRSDTIFSIASRLGITDREALEFLRTNSKTRAIARQLRPGRLISAQTTATGELSALYLPINGAGVVLVVERRKEGLVATEKQLGLQSHTEIRSGEINNSLFEATDSAGIPDRIAVQLAEIFEGEIDFYRDLRKGDRFSVVYEVLSDHGRPVGSGRVLSASFTNNKKTYKAYWFRNASERGAYYTPEGKPLHKAFLRSPLEFSRVTSGFSNARMHPVLHVSRAHKGIDYGAPQGTKVRAVADATVQFAGRQGGYGNLVILKHQGSYSTAYGHLKGFAPGIRAGATISQGEIIGFVGQTGVATGPHLHYEFRIKSHQVDPNTVDLPTAKPLDTRQIALFKETMPPLQKQLELATQISLAVIDK